MPSVKPMRYAHSDGHTDVCFDDYGKYDCSNHDYVDKKPKRGVVVVKLGPMNTFVQK